MSNSKFTKGRPPKKHYLPVPNDLIRDKDVSDGAFRVICWINSHHDDFEVTFTGIQTALSYGRDKLRAIVKDGIDAGYIVRQRFNDATTGLLGWIYAAFTSIEEAKEFAQSLTNQSDKPCPENPAMDDRPCPENPATVDPAMVNQGMDTYIDQEDQKEKNNFLEENPPIVPQVFFESGGGEDFVSVEIIPEEKEVAQVKTTSDRVEAEISLDEKVLSPVSIVPARENYSQSQKLSPIQAIFEESGKVLNHGIEYRTWIQQEMGDVIKHYRQSGRALTVSPNDIDPDFKSFTAANGNGGKGLKLAAAQGWIVNCEKDPLRWGELRDLVAEWLLAKSTGDRHTSIAQEINRASKPPIKLNLNLKF